MLNHVCTFFSHLQLYKAVKYGPSNNGHYPIMLI